MNMLLMYPLPRRYNEPDDKRMPTLAVYRLASLIRELGHEPVVVDTFDIPDGDLTELLTGVDLVGLSANSFSWPAALALSRRIKAESSVPVALGGIHPWYFDEHCLTVSGADFVVRGEGERSLPKLLDAVGGKMGFDQVPGLTWMNGVVQRNPLPEPLTRAELEQLPLPAYDLIPRGRYQAAPVETSRGCSHACAFCSIPHRGSWRAVSPERVVDLIRCALDQPGCYKSKNAVYLLDDCFTISAARATRTLDQIRELDAWLGLEARADHLTEPVVKALARHNIWLIQIGIECGYEEGLVRVNKRIRLEDVETAAANLQRYDLVEHAAFSFIVGLPWESVDECRQTISFILYLALKYGVRPSLSWYEPFPGSAIWNDRLDLGADVTEEVYDASADWRKDNDLFMKFRPRMTVDDCRRVEDLIDQCSRIVPYHLHKFQYRFIQPGGGGV